MKLEKGVITNTQLMFFLFSALQGGIVAANFNYALTKQDTWLAVLGAFVLAVPIMLIYIALAKKHIGKSLTQINEAVFGPYLGRALSVAYIWFFLQLMIHYAYFFNSFWITFIMPNTPRFIFVSMLFIVSAMAVKGGIKVIAQCGFFLAIIVSLMVVLIFVLLIKNMDFSNLLPVFSTSPKEYIQSVHVFLAIPILDQVAMLVYLPYVSNKKKITKPVLLALVMNTALLLLNVVGNLAAAGIRAISSTSVSYAITQEINIAEVLERLDVLIALTLLLTVFIKVTIFFYATVISAAETLRLNAYQPLIVPVALLVVSLAVTLYPSDMEQVYAAKFIWPFNAVTYEIMLPLLTLVVSFFRKKPKPGRIKT